MEKGTRVRVFAQRREIHERTKSGWRTKVVIIPERIGVIEDAIEPYSVYFPETDEYEIIHPTMLEPYGGD